MPIPALSWPTRVLPQLKVVGRFPLDERGFAYQYCHPTHALHLYEYAGRIRMGRREFALRPGDLTLSVADGRTRYDVPAAGHHWCVHFLPVPAAEPATVSLPWHWSAGAQRQYLSERLAEIARLHNQPASAADPARAAVLFQDLLLWLAGQASQPRRRSRAEQALDQLLVVLEQRFAEPWTVPQLAEMAGMSQDHLARCFRQRLGVTIPRYLLQLRVNHARQLLRGTDLPVRRIAARVGMPDPQHFNKQFRHLLGCSPSAVRAALADETKTGSRGAPRFK